MIRRERGFTLIEIVVALALAALVSLILFDGLRLTAGGVERISRHADRLDARHNVELLLRNTLEAAIAAPLVGGRPGFAGDKVRLDFVTLAESGGPGLYRIALGLDGARLILSRQFAVPFAEPQAVRSTLADGVRRFAITYFGATSPADPPEWHDTWRGVSFLPRLVRITLDTGDGELRFPIVVRLWNAG